ncbi:MAG: V-type ATPase subunit [Lachnospiraceae bacterium]|nr:V-type ATPase subunit [Lachnospiraceae bacterium]
MAKNYVYAIARVRSLELNLFTKTVLEQLIAEKDYESAIGFLHDHGWGNPEESNESADKLLTVEEEKTWADIREMVPDMSAFEVLLIPDLYHNLKAAIKTVVSGDAGANVFIKDTNPSGEKMVELIKAGDFSQLPKDMQECASEAFESFSHTMDGQICDIIIDKAALSAILAAGEDAEDGLLKEYAERYVAIADIRIALRASLTHKSTDFMKRAMVPTKTVSIERLMQTALQGVEEILRYLGETEYAGIADVYDKGQAAFECWCDNLIMETIKPQKYNSFTIGALVAYVLARLNEIKTVRIILSGKLNQLPESDIRERLREMYV